VFERSMTLAAAPNLARIPAGDFLMGASDADADQRPVHRVTIGEFFIGRFPVTNDEYAKFIRATGHPPPSIDEVPALASGGLEPVFRDLAAPYVWQGGQPPAGHANHPVVLVRYEDAVAYCAWSSEATQRIVRLPTEAEWEKAARGGAEGQRYPWGHDFDPAACSYLSDATAKRSRGTRPTGTYPPNAYGLCDMIGNVWEWVSDWYDAEYYGRDDHRNPGGPPAGALRVVRGGSWVTDDVEMLRCSYRHKVPPDTYAYSVGFRIACSA
jgi:formylglycine-generating enzyme required for sulfatase activity